jgi:ankyrin repeat protein
MDLVRSSIQQGSRVDSRTLISCNTPLHVAVLQDNINAVQLLVQAGANTALLNLEGRTPRDLAVNQEIINYLDNVDQLSRDLIAAVQAGNVELVRNLVAQGAPLMVPDSQGQTPLHYAIGGYAQQPTVADTIAQELIGVLGPRVALIQNQENQTLLHTAASRGNVRVALMLLQHGVDVNRADNQGDTALNVSGSVPMSRVLAENGAWQSMNAGPSSVPEEQRILALFAGNH